MSRAVTSGSTQVYSAGQKGSYNVFFDTTSTSTVSHAICVDNNFYRVEAFNLSGNETVTIEQVINVGQTNELITPYAPVSGPVTLTVNRSSYVIERPGYYRFTLSGGGLGMVKVIGFQFAMENEASQDIADAIYAALTHFIIQGGPGISVTIAGNTYTINNTGIITATATTTITPTLLVDGTGANLEENVNVSADAGNTLEVHSDGLYVPTPGGSTPCEMGALIPFDSTANNNVVSLGDGRCLVDQQLVSSDSGNLLQLRPNGLYYGILPPPNFTNQYVSSSTGNDSNSGTQLSPLKTIQKAISNLPDGTTGNILLMAGDTFHTYPTASSDVITGFTFVQSLALSVGLNIGNRIVTFLPYNDPAINAINAYNVANGTTYDPYIAAEINFPIIQVTLSLPTDSATYVPVAFQVGVNGAMNFLGINFVVGQTGTVNPSYYTGAVYGSGFTSFQGGHVTVGSVPVYGGGVGSLQQNSFFHVQIADHGTASTPPLFCDVSANQYTYITNPPVAPGGLIVPSLTYTDIGDNIETYLVTAALWPNITIYSTSNRSFRHVISSIAIA